jgi:hypothetical protein
MFFLYLIILLLHAAAPQNAKSGDGPIIWHTCDLASEVNWDLNPLALDMEPDTFFGLGFGDMGDLQVSSKCPSSCLFAFRLPVFSCLLVQNMPTSNSCFCSKAHLIVSHSSDCPSNRLISVQNAHRLPFFRRPV